MPVSSDPQELLNQRDIAEYQRSRNERLLDKLVKRFEPLCSTIVRKTCRAYEITGIETEEVRAEARIGVLRALQSYNVSQGRNLSSWCYLKSESYARNAGEQIQTRKRRFPLAHFANDADFHSYIDTALSRNEEHDPDYDEPTEWLQDHLAKDRIRTENLSIWEKEELRVKIKRLPSSLQPVATLILVEGKTQMETAAMLHISQSYVCIKLNKAKTQLANIQLPTRQCRKEEITLGDEVTRKTFRQREQEKMQRKEARITKELGFLSSQKYQDIEKEALQQYHALLVPVCWHKRKDFYLRLLRSLGYFEEIQWAIKEAEEMLLSRLEDSVTEFTPKHFTPLPVGLFGHSL